ncbi:ATP-binding protein [Streptomyces sp. NPDC001832]|uniref:ATP-binding protein n=1 Tax=Streptomyces sp. NPDC001832 TaxID=3154527 RepID=UPI00332C8C6D
MTAAQPLPAPTPEPALREDRLDYTPNARSVTLCRRRAARLVREWGHPRLASDTAILVNELATNALLHRCLQDRLFRVRLILTETRLRIEVTDPRGERLPGLRAPADDESYGRGLLIVDALAADWGVEQRTVGKTVFAELALPGSPQPHS